MHEGITIFGHPEVVHFEAWHRRHAGGGCLPRGRATDFNWKKKYDGLLPTEMRPLKQLEDENGNLKGIVADLSLDKEMLQGAIRRKH